MKIKRYVQIGIMLAVVLVMGQSGFASLYNDTAAISAYSGSIPFSVAGGVLNGYVDYAVYAPGKYDGTKPVNSSLYVYEYQVFSQSSTVSIDYFSVGLNLGVSASIPSSSATSDSAAPYAVAGGIVPLDPAYVLSQQVLYLFPIDPISANEHSITLLFASDIGPGMTKGVVSAGFEGEANMALPSPVPEPATMALFGVVSVLYAAKRGGKRQAV